MVRRWRGAVVMLGAGLVLGGAELVIGHVVAGVLIVLLFVAGAVVVSPRVFPSSVADAVARRLSAADGRPIVYWRPGCPFCMRLRARLGRDAKRVHWVDIWADPEGAAAVRAATGGDETVPTVVVAGEAHINPDPVLVIRAARA